VSRREAAVSEELRVAVVGVGAMGADHVARLSTRVRGARVGVVADAEADRARMVAAAVPGARVAADAFEAIAAADVDAVLLATPGPLHEPQLLACLDAGKPVLCEKPLTTDVAGARNVLRREADTGRSLIQVGFMRRFDREYAELRRVVASGALGNPLLIHCVHRNHSVPAHFDSAMVVTESLVHEVDVTRFLLNEEISAVTVVTPTSNSRGKPGLRDPQLALLETESGRVVDVELFVTTGVGYQVRTEVVGEIGTAAIGFDMGLVRTSASGTRFGRICRGYLERFGQAYDAELQAWVNAVRAGDNVAPAAARAADGYAATMVCAAAIGSLQSGGRVRVRQPADAP
jgi:myo-inositol 2-dehydrogenase/D-chiro-inositol 1-dehydrogenase